MNYPEAELRGIRLRNFSFCVNSHPAAKLRGILSIKKNGCLTNKCYDPLNDAKKHIFVQFPNSNGTFLAGGIFSQTCRKISPRNAENLFLNHEPERLF
jgi:hypothetical protein